MHIFHIITHFDIGGAERVAINIAKSKSSNVTYHLFEVVKGDSDFSSTLKKELQENGIQYHCSPFKNKRIAICLFAIWFIKYYLRYKPKIIHVHTEIPDLALWIFRKIACLFFLVNPKYIRTIHNTQLWNEWGKLGNRIEQYYIKHHCNIAISDSTRDCYLKRFGSIPQYTISNGLEEVKQQRFANLKQGKINILFAGRLEFQKGVDQLIEVISALKNDQRFHFHVVGNGSMKEKVHKTLGSLTNISLYDKIFGLNQYIGNFDYLFMPSNHEGLALLPIEASLAHTPTIINNCPGLKDTLPERWPLKVDNNNVDDFIQIILSLYNTAHYEEYATMAYEYAKTNFSIKEMQWKYELIYQKDDE